MLLSIGLIRLVALLLVLGTCSGYYLPGTFPQAWLEGEPLAAQVDTLKSFQTELPFDYYSLPFCKPIGGAKTATQNANIGTFLLGQRLETSPYNFTMMVSEVAKEACPENGFYGPLSNAEASNLKEKIAERYRVHMVLDNLPMTTYDLEEEPESVRTGFELGFADDDRNFYINNHIEFKILVHPVTAQFLTASERFYAAEVDVRRRQLLEDVQANQTNGILKSDDTYYTVVGFEAWACSIRRNPGWATFKMQCPRYETTSTIQPQVVDAGEKIVYTYDVEWEISEIKWVSRWDAYLQMPRGQVHWFSIMNSLLVVILLSGVLVIVMLRTIRRDLAKYEEMILNEDHEGQSLTGRDHDSGWKVLKGDVFRAPAHPQQLCILVGSGLQTLASCFTTLLFGALGFLSPAVRGAMLSTLLGMYMLLSMVAGFASVYLQSAMARSTKGWLTVAMRTTAFVPTLLVTILLFLNLLIMHTGSSGAIPFSALLPIALTWIFVCFPLGYLGGILGSRASPIEFPTRTNLVPRELPEDRNHSSKLIGMFLGSGLLVFGNVFVELYFAMTSMWQGYFYYLLGFVLVIGLLTVIITVQIAIVTTYMQFCEENYHWWWHSFHRGGAVALYIGVYALGFLIWSLHTLAGVTSVILYLVYMSMLVGAVYISLGSLGFVCSFWFTYSIFKTAKAD